METSDLGHSNVCNHLAICLLKTFTSVTDLWLRRETSEIKRPFYVDCNLVFLGDVLLSMYNSYCDTQHVYHLLSIGFVIFETVRHVCIVNFKYVSKVPRYHHKDELF